MASKHLNRSIVLACLLATLAYGAAASPVDDAMRCVQSAMTSSLLPVGLMKEQIANAALARCIDEIEAATNAIAGRAKRAAIDTVRAALREQLYDYAMQVTGPPVAASTYLSDTLRESQREW